MDRKREGQVIVLSIDAHAAYYQPRRWDGGWYTRDLAEARVYRRPGFAARLIEEFGEGWAIFHPVVRTIDLDSKGRPAAQTRRVCQSCKSHYPTPEAFVSEAARLGVSRRIARLPKGFVPGETVVLLAHRLAIRAADDAPAFRAAFAEAASGRAATVEPVFTPGIVTAFVPTAVELVLRRSEATAERIAAEAARGVTVVAVPDGDPDHDPTGPSQQGDLFDDGSEEEDE